MKLTWKLLMKWLDVPRISSAMGCVDEALTVHSFDNVSYEEVDIINILQVIYHKKSFFRVYLDLIDWNWMQGRVIKTFIHLGEDKSMLLQL